MNWFVWRQHRKVFLVFGAVLGVFAAVAVFSGNNLWDTYQQALSTCTETGSCDSLKDTLFQNEKLLFAIIPVIGLVLPLLLGLFVGGPLIAKEYEEGTNKLVWTQSISRRKWLTVKAVWALAFAALYGLALTLVLGWWSRVSNALYLNQFDQLHFATQGLMPVAYSLCFVAVGTMLGAWFKKVIVAMAMTLGVFVLLQGAFTLYLRANYTTPVTDKIALGSESATNTPAGHAWILSKTIVDNNGNAVDAITPANMPETCQAQLDQQASMAERRQVINDCLNTQGWHQQITYHPASRYWTFQYIEAGIYGGIAVLALSGTYRLVLRRDA